MRPQARQLRPHRRAGRGGLDPILASCDLTSNPGDPGDGDETPEPEAEVEVEDEDEGADREALPRTGAGLLALGAAGSALTGVGVTLRRLARR